MGLWDDIQDRIRVGRSDLNGYFALLIITILLIAVPYAITVFTPQKQVFTPRDRMILDSLRASFSFADEASPVFFAFDPNTLCVDSLVLLGLSYDVAQRIAKYRDKGGRFYRRSDLSKIYGLDSVTYSSLVPYIRIKGHENKIAGTRDLNRATSRDLQEGAGIDPLLAARIVAYRHALGGFVRMQQLYEVYDADSTLAASVGQRFFIAEGFLPGRININSAPEEALSDHPYISKQLANSIVLYRTLNGPIAGRQTLASFQLVDDALIEKLFPYLQF